MRGGRGRGSRGGWSGTRWARDPWEEEQTLKRQLEEARRRQREALEREEKTEPERNRDRDRERDRNRHRGSRGRSSRSPSGSRDRGKSRGSKRPRSASPQHSNKAGRRDKEAPENRKAGSRENGARERDETPGEREDSPRPRTPNGDAYESSSDVYPGKDPLVLGELAGEVAVEGSEPNEAPVRSKMHGSKEEKNNAVAVHIADMLNPEPELSLIHVLDEAEAKKVGRALVGAASKRPAWEVLGEQFKFGVCVCNLFVVAEGVKRELRPWKLEDHPFAILNGKCRIVDELNAIQEGLIAQASSLS